MKTDDISQTPLVRRYGLRGAKIFARLWFPFMYFALIGLAAAVWFVAPEVMAGWRRITIACISGLLIVVAASLLTRMRLNYLAAIERLEQGGSEPCNH